MEGGAAGFCGVTQVRETCGCERECCGWRICGGIWRTRCGMLAEESGFAAVAIWVAGARDRANTAIFSIAKSALLDRLDVPHAGELPAVRVELEAEECVIARG